MRVAAGNAEQRHVGLGTHRLGDAHRGNTGTAGYSVPALFECVGDTHRPIMPYCGLRNSAMSSPRCTTTLPSRVTVQ